MSISWDSDQREAGYDGKTNHDQLWSSRAAQDEIVRAALGDSFLSRYHDFGRGEKRPRSCRWVLSRRSDLCCLDIAPQVS